jgi:hypothetical protein
MRGDDEHNPVRSSPPARQRPLHRKQLRPQSSWRPTGGVITQRRTGAEPAVRMSVFALSRDWNCLRTHPPNRNKALGPPAQVSKVSNMKTNDLSREPRVSKVSNLRGVGWIAHLTHPCSPHLG